MVNKIRQETFYIDSNGRLSNSVDIEDVTIVDVAEFNHFSSNRKQRRNSQSLAARELLNASLKKYFPECIDGSCSLIKSDAGKPFLSGKDVPSISISHSGHWCASAIKSTLLVGIDIEVIQSRDWESYCNFAFHPKEAQWILAASDRERDVRGLICWCRKEALVKASGISLLASLSTIAFTAEGELIELPKELGEPLSWKFFTKVHSESLVVAVAWKISLD